MAVVLEDDIPVGNVTNKHKIKNPIAKKMVTKFHKDLKELIFEVNSEINEISQTNFMEIKFEIWHNLTENFEE